MKKAFPGAVLHYPLQDFYFDGNLVEDLLSYKPGGFHPVHLGETFSTCPGSDRPRYRVLQKLGTGHFSTVWLAHDMADNDRGVALKITRADGVHSEASILQTLSSPAADVPHQGKKHVLQLLDYFQIHGPNGTHDALVTDVLVPRQYLCDLNIFDAKRTCYESLLALSYSTQNGVIHGDLHTDNIAFVLPGLARLSPKVWMEMLDYPELIPVIPRKSENQNNSLPKYLVETADMTSVVQSVIKEHGTDGMYAVIIDFGSAFRTMDPIPEPHTPPYISAPETLIRTMHLKEGFYNPDWRFQGDIWSLGCSIFEMVARRRLFLEPKNRLLEEIISVAGPFPQSWLDLLQEKPKPHIENDESSLWAAAKVNQEALFKGEARYASPLQAQAGFHTLLKSMLKIDPAARQPPDLLVQSDWFDDIRGET